MSEHDTVATVCAMYETVLCVEGVEPDDDLFDLGGHSLLAAKLITEVLDRYAVRVPLADFLEDPTPRVLAQMIGAGA